MDFHLPRHEADAEMSPRSTAPRDIVILLVEDEAPVRAFASRALRLRGYQVIEAANGEEALSQLQNPHLQIDLFVSDVVMPGMDGPSWVQEALLMRPDVRVVFMTGYAAEFLTESCSKIPNVILLQKPFSLNSLNDAVRSQLTDFTNCIEEGEARSDAVRFI